MAGGTVVVIGCRVVVVALVVVATVVVVRTVLAAVVVVVVVDRIDAVVVTVDVVTAIPAGTAVFVGPATPVTTAGSLVRAIGNRFSGDSGRPSLAVNSPKQHSAATTAPRIAPRATRPCQPT